MARLTLHPATSQEAARLCLEGDLTIFEAGATHAALLALVADAPGPWTLDLSAVDEIDSAGLQLLIALGKSLGGDSPALHVTALSPTAGALIDLLRPDGLSIGTQRSACEG